LALIIWRFLMNNLQNKPAFTIVETLVAVTIVAVAMSLLLEAISQSNLIYKRVLVRQNSVQSASIIILTQKSDGMLSLSDEVDTSSLPEPVRQKASVELKNEPASMSLKNSSNMFLNLKKSVVFTEDNQRVEFVRFDKF